MILRPREAPEPELIPLAAVNPLTGEDGGWRVILPRRTLRHLEENGPFQRLWNVHVAADTLACPNAIFVGLNRLHYSEAYCYSLSPARMFVSRDETVPLPDRRVMVAFVVFGADGRPMLLSWEWRDEDLETPGCPVGYQTDFRSRIWPT